MVYLIKSSGYSNVLATRELDRLVRWLNFHHSMVAVSLLREKSRLRHSAPRASSRNPIDLLYLRSWIIYIFITDRYKILRVSATKKVTGEEAVAHKLTPDAMISRISRSQQLRKKASTDSISVQNTPPTIAAKTLRKWEVILELLAIIWTIVFHLYTVWSPYSCLSRLKRKLLINRNWFIEIFQKKFDGNKTEREVSTCRKFVN